MSGARTSTVKLTYTEYCQFPDDGNRHEIIDGVHYISPATGKIDEGLKKALYEQHNVPEYWVVDAEEGFVDQYVLRSDGTYGQPTRNRDSISFAGTTVDLAAVWARL